YMKGAEKNYSVSLYNVGMYYENGWGIEKDLQKALEFYKRAANLGYENAIKKVNELSKYHLSPWKLELTDQSDFKFLILFLGNFVILFMFYNFIIKTKFF